MQVVKSVIVRNCYQTKIDNNRYAGIFPAKWMPLLLINGG